jgi:hypothetical protein
MVDVKHQPILEDSLSNFHHYRDAAGMITVGTPDSFAAFELASVLPSVKCVLVADQSSFLGSASCLIFGTGAAPTLSQAVAKAVGECVVLRSNHIRNPNWCPSLTTDLALHPADVHHAASRDTRNLNRFRTLCVNAVKRLEKRPAVQADRWEFETLPSPLRYFLYERAHHPELLPLEFLKAEPGFDDLHPLFHPFW